MKSANKAAWAMLLIALTFGGFPRTAGAELSVETIVANMAATHEMPVGTTFRQDVTVRLLLATWRFSSVMQRTDHGFDAQTKGAPSFVPATLPADLVGLAAAPGLFDLSLLPNDGDLIVLHGPRIDYPGNGPMEATFWIDPATWTAPRAEAAYSWGKLALSQTYAHRGGRWLLTRQSARATPFGLTLEATYEEYRLP